MDNYNLSLPFLKPHLTIYRPGRINHKSGPLVSESIKGVFHMARIIKDIGEIATEELLQNLVGKLVHVPTNKHIVPNHMNQNQIEEINAWFAGQVAGYEKAYLAYDYTENTFLNEPHVLFNVLLTDGNGYLLNLENSHIVELTDEEFNKMLAEHQALTSIKETATELIVPERKIILPDEVK